MLHTDCARVMRGAVDLNDLGSYETILRVCFFESLRHTCSARNSKHGFSSDTGLVSPFEI